MQRYLLPFLILASCSFGIDGDETIRAKEAAGMLSKAALSVYLRCLDQYKDERQKRMFGMPQSTCIKTGQPSLLLRKTDVEGCVTRTAILPCMNSAFETDIVATNFALNCGIKLVPFIFNNVNHPFQGNIYVSLAKDESKFYFGCY